VEESSNITRINEISRFGRCPICGEVISISEGKSESTFIHVGIDKSDYFLIEMCRDCSFIIKNRVIELREHYESKKANS
jgi:hypothetical protein